jgi:CheY-like chemotaxis protein/anti-sigma regulatory factor (Ser/Thr protein kinase)
MHGDLTKTRQSLFNLLSNASKFTENGTVGLAVSRDTADGRDWVCFRVTDTGIGMTPEQTQKLFQPFTQADASTTRAFGGTGLGLAITRRFCDMLGGAIAVESTPGKGSTFTLRLPAQVTPPDAAADQDGPGGGADTTSGAALQVLIIDDDAAVRTQLRNFLRREGFRVLTAASGDEGLRRARQSPPDVITLDVIMPRMDGWAVLAALKADPQLADIPVIMLTMVDNQDLGYTLGASEYLVKPLDQARLATILRQYRATRPERLALVVEDDALTRRVLRDLLEKQGWAVGEAANGRAALERLAEAPPELIILDLMMPEMDGFEFVEAVREQDAWRTIPIIVLTAKDLTLEERQRLNGAVQKVLQKGAYNREKLMREVGNLVASCAGRRSRQESRPDSSIPHPSDAPQEQKV